MARPAYRIRCTSRALVFERKLYAPGALQVQRRVAGLFWIGVAVYVDHEFAADHVRRLVLARRLAKLIPKVVAEFDAEGMELTDESRLAPG
ncbi:hypothetical protein WL50_10685 [Burkholderia ubonensis]|uniref:hypothetical protein n=1 Tax=Burkholderia ubonensis TaxID=101571 RepID=UPI00076BCDAE|nr:hypothetical protein [Burkholderia ubonensis]KWC25380.1 hypothetical protein WL50_10685 [Burkholderia ubonensis]